MSPREFQLCDIASNMTKLANLEENIVFADPFIAPTPRTAAALVTGAAQRVGRSIAQDLASAGWQVVLHYNGSKDAAREVRDDIVRNGGQAEILQSNLLAEEGADQLITRANELFGSIGILVNNASVYEWDDAATATSASFDMHMDLHLRAPMILCQEFVERLPAHQSGLIINMLDSRVLRPTPRHLTYTLSKCALWTMTQTLAEQLAPRVRVNGIGPGPTLPPKGQTIDEFRARCERLPLQRPASLSEICQAVRFLVSQKAMTGQMLALDGGDHLVR